MLGSSSHSRGGPVDMFEKTVDMTPGKPLSAFPSSEVAALGWMVSLCESVSRTCCGPAVQSAGKPETP